MRDREAGLNQSFKKGLELSPAAFSSPRRPPGDKGGVVDKAPTSSKEGSGTKKAADPEVKESNIAAIAGGPESHNSAAEALSPSLQKLALSVWCCITRLNLSDNPLGR